MQRHQHNRFEMGRRVFVNPVKFFFVVVFYELYGFFFDKIPDINVGRCDAILFAQVEDCRDDGEVAVNGSGFAAFLFFRLTKPAMSSMVSSDTRKSLSKYLLRFSSLLNVSSGFEWYCPFSSQ